LIDTAGQVTVEPQYDELDGIVRGIAWAKRGERWCAIDRRGAWRFTRKIAAVKRKKVVYPHVDCARSGPPHMQSRSSGDRRHHWPQPRRRPQLPWRAARAAAARWKESALSRPFTFIVFTRFPPCWQLTNAMAANPAMSALLYHQPKPGRQ